MGMYLINHAHLLHHNLLPKLIRTQQSCVTLTVLDCDVGDEHDYSLFALTLPKIQAGRLQNHYAETLWNKQNVTSQVQLHTSPWLLLGKHTGP